MSLKKLARRLPGPLFRLLRSLYRRLAPSSVGTALVSPGPLITEIAPRLAPIPGWFNLDDLAHFTLVLKTQAAAGLRGDLLEIGCYHGRSAAVLAMHLGEGERLILADAFDLPLDEPYGDTPAPEKVWSNLASAVPHLPRERIEILRGYSRDLRLPKDLRVRFAHVDGGHDSATVQVDLALCARRLIPGGVLVVDDYAHPQYPGVSEGVRAFRAGDRGFRVLADLNRTGALGRKLYLVREGGGD
jgi:SAM-dependent methyltransferase